MHRLAPVDALRGLVMVIMALDHVRDFLHRTAMTSSPTDLAATTPVLFATRWVTHLCAPVFMLTAGIGAYLFWRAGGRTRAQLSRFLLTRGAWLIVLELTVMQLAYNFDVSTAYPILLLVLWVLGGCMVLMAALVWVPIRLLAALSAAVIVLHHLLDGLRTWPLVHEVSVFHVAGRTVIAPYTLVPWVAVMALGFCAGPLLLKPVATRQRVLLGLGISLTAAFAIVRALNAYGDPSPWAPQPAVVLTMLSFLNTTKYPPSLSFLLMTLGPALVLLAWFERLAWSRRNPLIVFGRVPLFYFVVHFIAAHAAAVFLAVLTYGSGAWEFMLQPVPSMGGPRDSFPPDFGYELWVTYAVWLLVVAVLYWPCLWFSRMKEQRRSAWLSYL